MTGTLEILNVGLGHNEIKVDDSNPVEIGRGKRIIQDMLKRGYALFVHGADNSLIRVKRFDPKKNVYVIGAEATLAPEVEAVSAPVAEKRGRGRPPNEKTVPVSSAKVTSIGRSAGG